MENSKASVFHQHEQLKQRIANIIGELFNARRREGNADIISELKATRENLMAEWKRRGDELGR